MSEPMEILTYAKSKGFFDEVIPEDETEQKAAAVRIFDEAKIAFDEGARGEVVKAILFMGGVADEEVIEGFVVKTGSGIERAYESKARASARIKKENLPIPPEIEGEPPTLPRDVTDRSDRMVRRLSSEFNACLARANYLVSLEEADEIAAKQIATYYYGRAMKRLRADDKDKVIPVLEAEANDDENYRIWKDRQLDHHIQVKLFKSLRDTYQQNCERLSREWTMRTEERSVTR